MRFCHAARHDVRFNTYKEFISGVFPLILSDDSRLQVTGTMGRDTREERGLQASCPWAAVSPAAGRCPLEFQSPSGLRVCPGPTGTAGLRQPARGARRASPALPSRAVTSRATRSLRERCPLGAPGPSAGLLSPFTFHSAVVPGIQVLTHVPRATASCFPPCALPVCARPRPPPSTTSSALVPGPSASGFHPFLPVDNGLRISGL